jgi:predicted MFS family arabinose efflux permease
VTAMNTGKRLAVCFSASALNLSSLFLSALSGWRVPFFYVALVIFADILLAWALLRRVKSSASTSEYLKFVRYSKRWMLILGAPAAALILLFSYAGLLEKWAAPLVLAGFAFFLVGAKILSISVEKRVDQTIGG